ncbi:MAG: toxin [Pseudomonadota bacterium]
MKIIRFDSGKNENLQKERGVSFDVVIEKISKGDLLDILIGKGKYSHQKVYVMEIGCYVYIIPFVETKREIFLKTIIPTRKLTKKYLGGREK